MTRLDKILDRAVANARAIRELEAKGDLRLDAQSFVVEAISNAGTDEATIDAVEEAIDGGQFRDAASALRMAERDIEGRLEHARRPWDRVGFYCHDDARQDLAALSATPMILFAIACRRVAQRVPEKFGATSLADFDKKEAEERRLRLERVDLFVEMQKSWCAADLLERPDLITLEERDRGLTALRFKRHPNVPLVGDWPQRLTDAAVAEADAKDENDLQNAA